MDRLGPDAMLVVWSAPTRTYSLDIDYPYRQDSNAYYLTGITQDETILVLMPGNRTRREILFVKAADPSQEHWSGRRLTTDQASAASGIQTVMTRDRFEPFVAAMLGRRDYGRIDAAEATAFFGALGASRARLALLADSPSVDGPPSPAVEFSRRLLDRFVGYQVMDASPIVKDLRLVKTPYERAMLARSVEISANAQLAGMRAARPGAYEYQVKAAIEAVHRASGASQSYPSIVGSGPNATILHYPEDDRQMKAGELILVDAGTSYGYMAADITRTYPVDGHFTPAERAIYTLVLRAQDQAIASAATGASLAEIHNTAVDVIKAGLLALGLITDAGGDQYKMWFTHSTSHYLGIDVHDPGDRTLPLKPGMAFTIEPGLYIRQGALDALPRTADNLRLIDRIQAAVTTYGDIGVRIEDSFLFDDHGLLRLSGKLPRTIEEIESVMKVRP